MEIFLELSELISSYKDSNLAWSLLSRIKLAPQLDRLLAVCLPIPEPAPVITIVLPFRISMGKWRFSNSSFTI
jgi:hypothetical protein